MTHYFFDEVDGNLIVEDKIGLDLDSVPTARECARVFAITKVAQRQTARDGYDARELHVRDSGGRYVAKIAFRYISI